MKSTLRLIVQVSVSEPPICIFITRELVTRMTSEAYVYIVDTVDSSPYKAMSRQLSVNLSILYVIKHLLNITVFPYVNFLYSKFP
jgi:tRNA A37 threonylcarbamoyladenosine dehydratase